LRIFLFFLLLVSLSGKAQTGFVVVDSIELIGNKRTLDEIVLRELNFGIGDSIFIEELPERIRQNSFLLLNTNLFTRADINIKNWNSTSSISLKIVLDEALYMVPLPIIEWADRNINVWWTEHNRDISRINYGGRFDHINLTGRRDHLRMIAQFGYTRKYEFKYGFPYLNRAKTFGLELVTNFKQQRQLQFDTKDNRQQFFPETREESIGGAFMYESFESRLVASYRKKIQWNQYFTVKYKQNRVADIIIQKNPDFFADGKPIQRFFELTYQLVFDSRDIKPYPTKGKRFDFVMKKEGVGIFNELNSLNFTASYSQYFPFGKRWIAGHNLRNRTALIRTPQPYFNSQALGFGSSFVRGYEFYVIDGIDFFLSRNTLSFKAFSYDVNLGKYMRIKKLKRMPTKLYFTGFGDTGYAYNPSFADKNEFSNRMLFGYGVGLNLVLYYNRVFILEYSSNGEGERGFFVRTEASF